MSDATDAILSRGPSHGRLAACILLGLALLAGAAVDSPVSAWVHQDQPLQLLQKPLVHYPSYSTRRGAWISRQVSLVDILKTPGNFLFTLAIAAMLCWRHPWKWRAGGLLCLSGVVGGLLYSLIKWSIGRTRPFKGIAPFELTPFKNGLIGLFKAENLSFPSGHTTLAFATAAMLGLLLPRWRWVFYAGAALVGVERVLENAHYPSDVVGGTILGVVSALLTWGLSGWLWNRLGGQPILQASANERA